MGSIIRGALAPEFSGYGDGNGYGYGYGNGYGNGNGYGGYGYGNGGHGDGYGNGYGNGYGDGNGNGYGYGYGYGDGDGYGDGYGYGYGYGGDGYGGDGKYWLACLAYFVAKLPASFAERARVLQAKGVKLAYWRSTTRGQPANQGAQIDTAAPGIIHKVSGPLEICTSRALHATLIPPKWKGERWWIVALHGEVVGDDEKMACLEREILGECI